MTFRLKINPMTDKFICPLKYCHSDIDRLENHMQSVHGLKVNNLQTLQKVMNNERTTNH